MILLDTNIISTLTLTGAMNALFDLFPNDDIGVSPGVYAEVVEGRREGRQFLRTAMDMVEQGKLMLVSFRTGGAPDIHSANRTQYSRRKDSD